MDTIAIVLAAGKGSRMKQDIPKQFLELKGFPLIYYSLKAFEESEVDGVVLVTSAEGLGYCKEEIVEKYGFHKVRQIIEGGSERYLSVYQGLSVVKHADIVLIHDGARPCVTPQIISRTIRSAEQYGSGIAAVHSKDTISQADAEQYIVSALERGSLWNVQTPQAFWYQDIYEAYHNVLSGECADTVPGMGNRPVTEFITDDASVLYYGGGGKKARLVEGDYQNIKVTTPEDLKIAALFL